MYSVVNGRQVGTRVWLSEAQEDDEGEIFSR